MTIKHIAMVYKSHMTIRCERAIAYIPT